MRRLVPKDMKLILRRVMTGILIMCGGLLLQLISITVYAGNLTSDESGWHTVEEEIWEEGYDPTVVPDNPVRPSSGMRKQRNGASGRSVTEYTCFGDQLGELARIVYDAMVNEYAVRELTGDITEGQMTTTFKLAFNYSYEVAQAKNVVFPFTGELDSNGNYVKGSAIIDSNSPGYQNIRYNVQSAVDAFTYDYPDVFWYRPNGYGVSYALVIKNKTGNTCSGDGYLSSVNLKMVEPYSGAYNERTAFKEGVSLRLAELDDTEHSDFDEDGQVSDLEYIQAVHDFIIQRMSYDYEGLNSYQSTNNYRLFTAAGAFLDNGPNRFVCEGYSKAMKILLNKRGIACCLIAGETSSGEGHMWNAVCLDGSWYLLDCTWDDKGDNPNNANYYANYLVPTLSNRTSSGRFSNPDLADAQTFLYPAIAEVGTHEMIQVSSCTSMRKFQCDEDGVAYWLPPALGHSWNTAYTVDQEPTCTQEGQESVHCTVCNAIQEGSSRPIEKIPHPWNTFYTTDQAATCTREGLESIYCSVCGEKQEGSTQTVEKTAHSYGEWETVTEATCTQTGSRKKVCTVCSNEVMEELPVTEHPWNTVYTTDQAATCTQEGLESIYCSACGEKQEGSTRPVEKTAHPYGEWETVTEPTCTQTGSRRKTCTVCGDTVTEDLPVIDHSWETNYTVDREATCVLEGEESIHCAVCGAIQAGSERSVEKIPHTYGDWETVNEPTCTETGSKKKECIACGDTVTEELPVIDHTWKTEYTVDWEAACNQEGQESIHCMVCGAIQTGSERSIERIPHTYGDWETVKEPTCTETGSKKKECTACGDTVTEELPVTDHMWKTDYTVDREPTCTEEGEKSIHCAVCGIIKEGSAAAVEKTAHPWNTVYTTDQEATCTQEGLESVYCSACGEKQEGSTRPVKKTAHAYGGWEIVTNATCTQTGSRRKACTACGDTVTEQIPANGHTWDNGTITQAVTPYQNGQKKYTCSGCHMTRTEEIMPTAEDVAGWIADLPVTAGVEEEAVVAAIRNAFGRLPAAEQQAVTQQSAGKLEKAEQQVAAAKQKKDRPEAQQEQSTQTQTQKQKTDPQNPSNPGKPETQTKTQPETQPANTPQTEKQSEQTHAADGTAVGKGASVSAAEKAIISAKSDEGPKGSQFGVLALRQKKAAKNTVTITWNKISGATYTVYGNACGKPFKKLKTLSGTSFKQKKLKKGTYYKYLVVASKNGKVVSASKTVHIATTGGKAGNPKKITVGQGNLKLGKKKTSRIEAKQVPASKKLKVKKHRKIMFESANPKVAGVSANGKVKALKKGKTVIYVYAQNGIYAKVKVTVR